MKSYKNRTINDNELLEDGAGFPSIREIAIGLAIAVIMVLVVAAAVTGPWWVSNLQQQLQPHDQPTKPTKQVKYEFNTIKPGYSMKVGTTYSDAKTCEIEITNNSESWLSAVLVNKSEGGNITDACFWNPGGTVPFIMEEGDYIAIMATDQELNQIVNDKVIATIQAYGIK